MGIKIPGAGPYTLRNCSVLTSLAAGLDGATDAIRVDVTVRDGKIVGFEPAGRSPTADVTVDLAGGMIWPCFADLHTHLDKGQTLDRAGSADGTLEGGLKAIGADRALWTADDLEARMDFALRCALAHGSNAVRTHIDSHGSEGPITWQVFDHLRAAWKGRIDLQGVSLFKTDALADQAFATGVADLAARFGGIFGAATRWGPHIEERLELAFSLAQERGLALDFHVDETDNPDAAALRLIAQIALRQRFEQPIVVGHCCSLALQSEGEIDRTLDLVAEANLAVVSLPLTNVRVLDRRPKRTPRWRGVTLLHEMRARGIRVAIASDNVRDPLHPYGDYDLLDTYRDATKIAHLDLPVGDWPASVSVVPASIMGLPDRRLRSGTVADFILFPARNLSELLSRPQAGRVVVRAGAAISSTPPDFAELDQILMPPSQ